MKNFKRIAAVALIIVMCISAAGCSKKGGDAKEKYGSDVLKVFMPGEYIADNLIPDFEKEFGVTVIPELFDSNEMMYTKFSAGESYDILIPSDYMIERLIKQNMLQKLELEKIPNKELLAEQVKNLPFDPDNTYSIPYFWGSVGLVYNEKNVDPADVEKEGWSVLKDTKYKGHIYVYDSERDEEPEIQGAHLRLRLRARRFPDAVQGARLLCEHRQRGRNPEGV
ncbi:MAG: extracellular solute-binding protein [Lachnospiraceae bacterium]|nr:extracellular solute-binding protein [Lachnospiraceae bacterium]